MKKSRRCNITDARVRRATGTRVLRPNSAALAFACALIALVADAARAQAPEPSAPPPVPPRAAPPVEAALAASTENTGRFYAFAGFAGLAHQQNNGLTEKNSLANFMAGGGFRASPNLAVELAAVLSSHDLDTPASATPPAGTFAAGTQQSTMITVGFAASAKYNFATDGRVVPYAGGGIGAYTTHFDTTTEATGCVNNCGDTGPRVSARSTDVGYHALVGADFHFTSKDMFSAEIRYLYIKADFGSVLPGKPNVGGTFLWMGYRRAF